MNSVAEIIRAAGYPVRRPNGTPTNRVAVPETNLTEAECELMSAEYGSPQPAGYMSESRHWLVYYDSPAAALDAAGCLQGVSDAAQE